jgi:hypothetical protein
MARGGCACGAEACGLGVLLGVPAPVSLPWRVAFCGGGNSLSFSPKERMVSSFNAPVTFRP